MNRFNSLIAFTEFYQFSFFGGGGSSGSLSCLAEMETRMAGVGVDPDVGVGAGGKFGAAVTSRHVQHLSHLCDQTADVKERVPGGVPVSKTSRKVPSAKRQKNKQTNKQ